MNEREIMTPQSSPPQPMESNLMGLLFSFLCILYK